MSLLKLFSLNRSARRRVIAAGFLALTASASAAGAQPQAAKPIYRALYDVHDTAGSNLIAPPVLANDGVIYGVAFQDGKYNAGTVYKVAGNKIVDIYVFHGASDGANPVATPTLYDDGWLYGVTAAGGKYGLGVVYRVNPVNGKFVVLHSFSGGVMDGGAPAAGLTLGSDDKFYGTTTGGGANGDGAVYQMTSAGAIMIVHSMNAAVDGSDPTGPVVQDAAGDLITTARDGGQYGGGTVFGISTTGAIVGLYSFGGVAGDGANPETGVTSDGAGGYVGVTAHGGMQDAGSVFTISPDGDYAQIASFASLPSLGGNPLSGLVSYGHGLFFGADAGEVYAITSGGDITAITQPFPTGVFSLGVTLGPDGDLYGTGTNTVVEITPNGVVMTIATQPSMPVSSLTGPLTQIGAETFLGTAEFGGRYGGGAVYTITTGGVLTPVHDFKGPDGYEPTGNLVRGADGNYYGVALKGGKHWIGGGYEGTNGVIYRLSPGGHVALVHSFAGSDGAAPEGRLVVGSDGALYGTTYLGGTDGIYGDGVIYKCSTTGDFHVLHAFSGADGANPQYGMTLGSDGWLYGIVDDNPGGASDQSTIYRIRQNGSGFETLYVSSTGENFLDGIVEYRKGVFYGTSSLGGANQEGSIFKFVPKTKTLTTIYSFDLTDGIVPHSLMVASDGNLYGASSDGGPYLHGTIFQFDPDTTVLANLYAYNVNAQVSGPLTEGANGDLYGIAASGGFDQTGEIFELDANLPPF